MSSSCPLHYFSLSVVPYASMGTIAWAEAELKIRGYVKRRTKLKRLSAKTIAKIVKDLVDKDNDLDMAYDSSYDD